MDDGKTEDGPVSSSNGGSDPVDVSGERPFSGSSRATSAYAHPKYEDEKPPLVDASGLPPEVVQEKDRYSDLT